MKNSALPKNRRVKSILPTESGDPALLYRWNRGKLEDKPSWSKVPRQGNR